MATIFRDAEGIILVDFLEENATITKHYDAILHFELREAVKEKLLGDVGRGVLRFRTMHPFTDHNVQ